MDIKKRKHGKYFTTKNPFENEGFFSWANKCNLPDALILEPFAGSNNLIKMLKEMGLCSKFEAFDIDPNYKEEVKYKDTLANFPSTFNVCVTNPPYLAKNSAKRRGISFPVCQYDDLYKFALDKCLQNCENVAAIIPASFLNSNLFRNRLSCYILLNEKMFDDTSHPVCLALFEKSAIETEIYYGKEYIGKLAELETKLPPVSENQNEIIFNEKSGNIGLYAIDNTKTASIKFCEGKDISPDRITFSSRSITRIKVETQNTSSLIKKLNDTLMQLRFETKDLFLTPFKGLREDGYYRRRLDFSLVRNLINNTL